MAVAGTSTPGFAPDLRPPSEHGIALRCMPPSLSVSRGSRGAVQCFALRFSAAVICSVHAIGGPTRTALRAIMRASSPCLAAK